MVYVTDEQIAQYKRDGYLIVATCDEFPKRWTSTALISVPMVSAFHCDEEEVSVATE